VQVLPEEGEESFKAGVKQCRLDLKLASFLRAVQKLVGWGIKLSLHECVIAIPLTT
jgi:hypothetical protein